MFPQSSKPSFGSHDALDDVTEDSELDENAAVYDMGEDQFAEPDMQDGEHAALYDMGEAEVEEEPADGIDETSFEAAEAEEAEEAEESVGYGFEDSTVGGETDDSAAVGQAEDDMMYGNVDTSQALSAIDSAKQGITEADVGRRCVVEGYEVQGVVRFVGAHATKKGPRVGVELDEAVGINNGTIAVSQDKTPSVALLSCTHIYVSSCRDNTTLRAQSTTACSWRCKRLSYWTDLPDLYT